MAHTQTFRAIILQTHDVGEADRFCILLTRERGKIAARARGVRKMQSRIGGSLMQGKEVLIDLHQGSAGALITGVKSVDMVDRESIPLSAFVEIQEGVELLLALLHDEEPLPEIYDALQRFIGRSHSGERESLLPFVIEVLSYMGLMPEKEHGHFSVLGDSQKLYLEQCMYRGWEKLPILSTQELQTLSRLCSELLTEHTSRRLKVSHIAQNILRHPVPALMQESQ